MVTFCVVREFRPSLRSTLIIASFLAVASWLVLRIALRMDPRPATIATVCALASLLALRLAFARPQHGLHLDDEGLSIRSGNDARIVPWSLVRRLALAYGEVETRRGVARVQYARIELASGPPVAFADLSALDGAEVVMEETPTPVIDIADPEILLGIIAERIGAREFLPAPARVPLPRAANRLGGLGAGVILMRSGFFAVLAIAISNTLWDAPNAEIAAVIAGIASALAVAAASQFVAGRLAFPGPTHTPAVASLFPTLLLALVTWRLFATTEHAVSAAWMLATALALALPVGPLPGASVARSIGTLAARPQSDALAAVLIAAAGAASAILLARGMKVIPIAILAGCAEGAEGYLAGLRASRLADAPRFAEWPLESLVELRSMLRASFDDDLADRSAALDRSLLERSEMLRRRRHAPLSIVIAALVGIALTVAVARHTTRLGSSAGRDAIGVLTQ